MFRWGRNLAAKNKRKMFITILKIPKVRKINGKDKSWRTGFIRAFISPMTAPAISKFQISPVKRNPGTSFVAIKIATELAKIRIIMLI
jgi:hypothetical protein